MSTTSSQMEVSTNASSNHGTSFHDSSLPASSNSVRFGDMTLSELASLYHRLKGPFEEIEDAYRTRFVAESESDTNTIYDPMIFTNNAHMKRFTQWRLLPTDHLLLVSTYLSNHDLTTVSCVNRRWLSGTKLPLGERHRKFLDNDPSRCGRCRSSWSQIRLDEWLTSHPTEVASMDDPITTLRDCIIGVSDDRNWCSGCYGEWMCPPCGLNDGWMHCDDDSLERCDDCWGDKLCRNCSSLAYCQFCSRKSCSDCGGVEEHNYRQMCSRCARDSY